MLLKLRAIVIVAFTHDTNSSTLIVVTTEVDALLDDPKRQRPSPCAASDERGERYATGGPIGRQGACGAAQATLDGTRSFHGYFLAVLAPARVERPFGVEATVGVGAKIVAQ